MLKHALHVHVRGMMLRRFALLGSLVVALAYCAAANADPSHNLGPTITYSCDNGTTVVVSTGTLTNHSHQAFAIDSTSIFVANYVAVTDSSGTAVLWDTAPGLTPQGLVTCTGDLGGGATVTARGFFTPR